VVVVGAGIVGASIAYHLARAGAPVTLLDRASSPAAGVTGKSFAWIGDTGGEWPGGAEDLRAGVIADYRRLEKEIPGFSVRWTGSLDWTGQRAGRWIDRRHIQALEPHLRTVPAHAVYSPTDGGVDPTGMTIAMVEAARRLGAGVVMGSAVTSLIVDHGRVLGVSSSTGYHAASTVVLAAGVNVSALAEPVGVVIPGVASPALLVHLAAPVGLVRTIVATPHFEAREIRPGHLLLTAPDADAGIVEQTVDRLRDTFHIVGPVRLLDWSIGERPMPAGGPLGGFLTPDRCLYAAVTHSGITLAPTFGRLIAQHLTTGKMPRELRRCQPDTRTGA
jgi:glycine/D-amino acid oxidase-like deaminating enzyme